MTPPLSLIDRNRVGQSGDAPLHTQLRQALREAIFQYFEDGDQFWTEDAIIQHLDLSQGTVRRALLDLAREGLLLRKVAKGSFVRKPKRPELGLAVGVFVPEYGSDLFTMNLEALAVEAWDRDLRMRVYHTHNGEKSLDAFRQIAGGPLDERLILLANPPGATRALHQAAAEAGYRIVDIGMAEGRYRGAYVSVDDHIGVRLALEHLVCLGHSGVLFLVNEPEDNPVIAERARLFKRLSESIGLKKARVVSCGTRFWEDSYKAAYDHMPQVWSLRPRPTAIFASSDQGAWAVLNWAAQNGVLVPDEVSVIGYDDVNPSKYMHPPLTTVTQPLASIARAAMDILWSDGDIDAQVAVPPLLAVRASTAPVRSTKPVASAAHPVAKA